MGELDLKHSSMYVILLSESSSSISVPAAVNISVHVNASVSEHVSCIGQTST